MNDEQWRQKRDQFMEKRGSTMAHGDSSNAPTWPTDLPYLGSGGEANSSHGLNDIRACADSPQFPGSN